MPPLVRSGWVALVAVVLAAVANAQQTPTPAPTAAGRADEVVATVNGTPITKADVLNHLSHFSFPKRKHCAN